MTASNLSAMRAIVRQMPHSEAKRLRRILSVPCGRQTRSRLITREGLPLGAHVVAWQFTEALSELRRAA